MRRMWMVCLQTSSKSSSSSIVSIAFHASEVCVVPHVYILSTLGSLTLLKHVIELLTSTKKPGRCAV